MGLANVISKGVSAGFKVLGDLKSSAVYYTYKRGAYSPDNGSSTKTKAGIELPSDVVLVKYKKKEVDGENVLATDYKALIIQSDMPNVRPAKSDRIYITKLRQYYRVMDIGQDPAEAMWILKIREGK